MIVVDIETSGGLNPDEIGIWQIGAIELENPSNAFLEDARIDDSDIIEPIALQITGKTEKELRDKNKQSQKQLIINFLNWTKKIKNKDFLCHKPQFDYSFIYIKTKKYNIPFQDITSRCFDLHTIAAIRYYQLNNKFLIKTEKNESDFGLTNILKFCGIEDTRIKAEENKIKEEGTPHNGLEDAKLEAECFSRLVFGKSLLPEFKTIPVPDYLKA